jgi:hypothetical protein
MSSRRAFVASIGIAGINAFASRASSAFGAARGGPAEVLIIRHAEEPAKGRHLNAPGRDRAAALTSLFPGRFAAPTALFAPTPTKQSARSTETLEPLAAALHLHIDETYAEPQFRELARAISTRAEYAGSHVMICWHHETIVDLAAAFGVEQPPKWPRGQYDHVWRIRFAGGRASLTDEAQDLRLGSRR